MGVATKEAPAKNGAERTLPPQFESFNRSNCVAQNGSSSQCSIRVSATGGWGLSRKLTAVLQLKNGSGLAFHYDGTQESWYLERDDENGFALKADSKGDLVFSSAALYKRVKPSFPEDNERGRMRVSEEPLRVGARLLYLVITASLVTRKRS